MKTVSARFQAEGIRFAAARRVLSIEPEKK